MKIYIAAPYPTRDDATALMHKLESQGYVVTSRWLKAPDELNHDGAQKDLDDVEAADVLVALNDEPWHNAGTGGRHVEFGYALALKKTIVLVGNRSNIFHHLRDVRVVERPMLTTILRMLRWTSEA